MRKLLIGLMLCFLLVGCQKDKIDINEPVVHAAITAATVVYIEKNPSSVPIILEANEFLQAKDLKPGTSIVNYKNAYLKQMMTGRTPAEKIAILTLTDLAFNLANEEFDLQGSDLIEPEYLGMVKQLFQTAANAANLYKEVE